MAKSGSVQTGRSRFHFTSDSLIWCLLRHVHTWLAMSCKTNFGFQTVYASPISDIILYLLWGHWEGAGADPSCIWVKVTSSQQDYVSIWVPLLKGTYYRNTFHVLATPGLEPRTLRFSPLQTERPHLSLYIWHASSVLNTDMEFLVFNFFSVWCYGSCQPTPLSAVFILAEQQLSKVNPWFADGWNHAVGWVTVSQWTTALKW